ncbi:MAG: hypothetical protein KIT84_19345 [Labilithrix sp.]|nr:hypothetical protein [Labilithrix sp.]MCW5813191.1 hypothetical protein [Labilithrix sp.]
MNDVLRRALTGAAAGILATGVMTLEFAVAKATGLLGEPPPKKLTRRILTLVGHRPRGAELQLATAAAHVGYGAAAGALFGLLPRPARSVGGGVLYGLAIWAVSYAGWIPKLHLMRPPSRDRFGRPTSMALAHVVYGASLATALQKLRASKLQGNATEPFARNVSVPSSADKAVTVAPTPTVPAVNGSPSPSISRSGER